jgi:hypothetical protein
LCFSLPSSNHSNDSTLSQPLPSQICLTLPTLRAAGLSFDPDRGEDGCNTPSSLCVEVDVNSISGCTPAMSPSAPSVGDAVEGEFEDQDMGVWQRVAKLAMDSLKYR